MTFFNKKEEVLEVVLTRVGRGKLATGQFNPTHYEFLDEDIIYDINYVTTGNITFEEQNQAKTRIKDKITLRSLTAKQGATGLGIVKNAAPKSENRVIESLGTFTPYSKYRPAWQIEAIDGALFTGSGEIYYTPSVTNKNRTVGPSYEKIPQIPLSCSYNYNFYVAVEKDNPENKFYSDLLENPFVDSKDLFKDPEDDSFVLFKKDFNDFTVSVEEENVLSSSSQFEMEVYKYEYSNNYNNAELKRLYFEAEDITDESVEWYFDVSFDAEVESQREGFVFVDEPLPISDIDDECEPGYKSISGTTAFYDALMTPESIEAREKSVELAQAGMNKFALALKCHAECMAKGGTDATCKQKCPF